MIWKIIDLISPSMDILLYAFFFTRCLRIRNNAWIRLGVASVCFLALKVLLTYLRVGYNEYLSVLLSLVFCRCVYVGSLQVYTIWAFIAVVTNGIVNFFVLSIAVAIPGASYDLLNYPGVAQTVCIIFTKLLLFLCYFVMTINNQRRVKVKWSNTLLLMCLSIGCWALLEIFFTYTDALQEPMSYCSLPIIGSAGMLVVMISSTVLYNQLCRQEREFANLQIRLRTAQLTTDHIEQQKDLYERLSRVQHGLRNHFAVITRYIQRKEYTAAEKYLAELNPSEQYAPLYAGNFVLDALISARVSLARVADIDFLPQISMPSEMPISDVALSILFGGLLDNAFEAVAKLPHSEQHFIKIATRMLDEYWVIVCQNSTDDKVFRTVDSIPSTKNESELHGIGTREIVEIAQKTGGFATFGQKDGVFTATVMLMLAKEVESAKESEENGCDHQKNHMLFGA